jgi:hypothetical protein
MQGPAHELQRTAERLTSAGVECALVGLLEEGDGSSRGETKLRLVVASRDVERCREIFDADWRSGLDPDQLAAADAASRIVIDPEAAETTCPACLTTFATGPQTCPECGLTIG